MENSKQELSRWFTSGDTSKKRSVCESVCASKQELSRWFTSGDTSKKQSVCESVHDNKQEFLALLCNLYIIALLAILPLYTKGTYYLIGDAKYQFFLNVSLICLGLWILAEIAATLENFFEGKTKISMNPLERMQVKFGREGIEQEQQTKTGKERINKKLTKARGMQKLSAVDIFMLSYGACVLLSALFSVYEKTPWMGYQDWHMGAISQILFIGGYFFVSRHFDGSAYPLYLGEAALFVVVILGLGGRLGLDITGMMKPFGEGDWEYSHMLSTVGNINWLCGYLAVMISFPLSGCMNDRRTDNVWKKRKNSLLFLTASLALTLLVLQGSDMGVVLAAAGIGICLAAGYFALYKHHGRYFFEKGILLAAAMFLEMFIISLLTVLRSTLSAMPSDSPLQAALNYPFCFLAVAFVFFILYFLLKHMPDKAHRAARTAILVLGAITAAACGIWYLSKQPVGHFWGSGRGGLWTTALKGFMEAGALQKLIGVGPDCFAEYLYHILPTTELYVAEGRWQGAVFANAHNEWLNQLVNLGILGTAAYAGIFVSAVKRYRGMLLGIFAIVLYGIASLTGFQQVLSTPLLFMVLGLCENRYRLGMMQSRDAQVE